MADNVRVEEEVRYYRRWQSIALWVAGAAVFIFLFTVGISQGYDGAQGMAPVTVQDWIVLGGLNTMVAWASLGVAVVGGIGWSIADGRRHAAEKYADEVSAP